MRFLLANAMKINLCVVTALWALATIPRVDADWPGPTTTGPIQFDVRSVVPARIQGDPHLVHIDLWISAMVPTIQERALDQWTIQVVPRNESVQVEDYSPRTKAATGLAGPIEVKATEENSQSIGMGGEVLYGPARLDSGMDRGKKSVKSTTYQQLPPMLAVTAAGTIRRGSGVYFKLRSAGQQILEGEKKFTLTLRVSPQWRADLLDVRISGEKRVRGFPGLSPQIQTVAQQDFVVATYRFDDPEAQAWAENLSRSEQDLRLAVTKRSTPRASTNSLTGLLHRFASKLELNEPEHESTYEPQRWVDRLVRGTTNPYTDPQIAKLPVEIRVLAIEYCEQVSALEKLQEKSPIPSSAKRSQYVAAKLPMAETND